MKNEISTIINELKKNQTFKICEDKFQRKSLFNIFGIVRDENIHSNFIAWFLDPSETHKLAFQPLVTLLKTIYISHRKEAEEGSPKASFDLIEKIIKKEIMLFAAEVEREYSIEKGRPDICITLEAAKKTNTGYEHTTITLVIENKIKSKEHNKQTETYAGEFKNNSILLYLRMQTEDNEKSKKSSNAVSKKFINIDYTDLLKCIDAVSESCGDLQTKFILDDYISGIINNYNGKFLFEKYADSETIIDLLCNLEENLSEDEKEDPEDVSYFLDKNSDLLKILIAFIEDKKNSSFDKLKQRLRANLSQRIMAQKAFNDLIKSKKDGKDIDVIVNILTDQNKCNKMFTCQYPVLSKERKIIAGHQRYIRTPEKLNDEEYYFTNHWFPKNTSKFVAWCEKERGNSLE